MSCRAIFLPGSVLPAEPAYGALLAALGSETELVAKDLEVYAGAEPPGDYSLDTEVAGVLREADTRGWKQFHLAGYSGGGAAALAFTASIAAAQAASRPITPPPMMTTRDWRWND